jgi:DmsE family decaheme c-type cytochrome
VWPWAALALTLSWGLAGHAWGADADCAACHEATAKAFGAVTHGKIRSHESPIGRVGCESCHGDGGAHAEAGGDASKIRRLAADEPANEVAEVCVSCHRSESLHDWAGSAHERNEVGCTDCHDPHGLARRPKDPDVCFPCHRDLQAQMQYPSHHPVREGRMTCGGCHTPHGGPIGLVRNAERPAELCLGCHAQYQGPFVFEHDPVSEGCDVCHAPHGSVANNLLVQNEPFLCLQCHEFHFHAGLEGEEEEEVYIRRYDPAWEASDGYTYPSGLVPNPLGQQGYKAAFTTRCTQCHTRVHGTDLPSQTVSGVGKGLTR